MSKEMRTIDAYTLAEEIESLKITVAGKPARWNDAKHSVLRIIAEQPDVDAVVVTRCKDCLYCKGTVCIRKVKNGGDHSVDRVHANFFCAAGKRRDRP